MNFILFKQVFVGHLVTCSQKNSQQIQYNAGHVPNISFILTFKVLEKKSITPFSGSGYETR